MVVNAGVFIVLFGLAQREDVIYFLYIPFHAYESRRFAIRTGAELGSDYFCVY